jgi:hypothetical protein
MNAFQDTYTEKCNKLSIKPFKIMNEQQVQKGQPTPVTGNNSNSFAKMMVKQVNGAKKLILRNVVVSISNMEAIVEGLKHFNEITFIKYS